MSHSSFLSWPEKGRASLFSWISLNYKKWNARSLLQEELILSRQGHLAEGRAGLMQSQTCVTQILALSTTPQGLKAEQGGRGNISCLHSLHHTHHKTFSVKRFQSWHEKLLLWYGSCSEEHIPLNGLAHDTSNNHLCSNLLMVCRWLWGGNSLSWWAGCISAMALSLWTAPRLPSTFCGFSQAKDGAHLCQELMLLPSSHLDTFVALAEAAKGTMWAHSLDVPRWLPVSGSYNARRMAESFMPAEYNALWSCDVVQKAGGVGSPAGTWLKRLGEMRGDGVLLCASPTSITSLLSKSFHRAVMAIVLQTWCISIPTTLTVWDSHTASLSCSWQRNEQLVWLWEKAKCVQLRHLCANHVQGGAA